MRQLDRSEDDPSSGEVKFVDLRNRVHSNSSNLFQYRTDKGERDWAPERAFMRQGPDDRPWYGVKKDFPQSIWYDFKIPTLISKIGFRNRREQGHSDNNPTSFEFIASNDSRVWKILKKVEQFNWDGNDRQKIWPVQTGSAMKPFKLYGIRVSEITGRSGVCIQDIKMWGKNSGPTMDPVDCQYKKFTYWNQRTTFTDAQAACKRWARGGHLVMEKTKEIKDEVSRKFKGSAFWVGVKAPNNWGGAAGNFKFTDSTTIREPYFKSNQAFWPSITCVYESNNNWIPIDCWERKGYICQRCNGLGGHGN